MKPAPIVPPAHAIQAAAADPALPFVCPICGRPSWHPRDLAERFCRVCGFMDDRLAAAAYCNSVYPARACDGCGKSYQGPAVYCSLECAVADA
jgi:ribosomal protein L37E